MSDRAEKLAQQFERASDEVRSFIEACPDAGWFAVTESEGWTVAAVCRHIVRGFEVHPHLIEMVANGQPLPTGYTREANDRSNAAQAREWAHSTKDETLALLGQHSEHAAAVVRALTDAQLDRTGTSPYLGDTPVSVTTFVEGMIAHPDEHLPSIRATAGMPTIGR